MTEDESMSFEEAGEEKLTRAVVDERVASTEGGDHGDAFSSVVSPQSGVLDVPSLHHNTVSNSRSASLLDGAVSALRGRGERVSAESDHREWRSNSP